MDDFQFKVPQGVLAPSSKKAKFDGTVSNNREMDAILDQAQGIDLLTRPKLEKLLRKVEAEIGTNQSLRMKHADDPLKYIDSEADLAEACKDLTRLSEQPGLYNYFIKQLQGHIVIGQLLAHPNTDIGISAIGLLNELTDDDVASGEGDQGESVEVLVNALVTDSIMSVVLEVLGKLDEEREDDKQGVFNALSLIENCVSVNPDLDAGLFEIFSPWLLTRVGTGKGFDSVRGYVAEIIAILTQSSLENRLRLVELGGLDTLLQILSYYRKRDPKDADEVEMMENVFDVVCTLVDSKSISERFVDSEGIELMLIMIKERKMSRMRAFKVIDHALQGDKTTASTRFVSIGGLKSLFTAFMKKGSLKYKKAYKDFSQDEEDEHVASIIFSLFVNLQDNEELLNRLVFKFIEEDLEKLHRLLLLHITLFQKIANLKIDDYLDRLDAGLFTLQLVDAILLFISRSNELVSSRIPQLFEQLEEDFSIVRNVVQEYWENLDDQVHFKDLIHSLIQ